MSMKLTPQVIQKRLDNVYHGKITFIGHYKDANTKTIFKCNHNHKFRTLLRSLLRYKTGCPQCYWNEKFDKKLFNEFDGKLKRLADLNSSKKIPFECNHHHIFKRSPEQVQKTGCPVCRRIKKCLKEIKQSTHGQFHPENIYRDYHGEKSKIVLICNHGHKIKRIVADVVRYGATCQKCHYIRREKKLKCILADKNITLKSHYKNVKAKVNLKCLNCGHEWATTPDKLFRGEGCPICNNGDMNDYIFRKRLDDVTNGKVKEAKGCTYHGFKRLTKFVCNHGHAFKNLPKNILRNPICPECKNIQKKIMFKKRDSAFRHDLNKVHHGYIKESEKSCYHGMNQKVLLICKKGHSWYATPGHVVLSGEGCPYCNTSHGEIIVQHELEKINLKHCFSRKSLMASSNAYKHSFRIHAHHHLLSIDFMVNLGNKSYAIEFDGIQHFKPVDFSGKLTKWQTNRNFKKQKKHDKWKNEWCAKHHVKMIRIENIYNYPYGRRMIKLVKDSLNEKLPNIQQSLF